MSDRNVRARLVIDYAPESRAAVREAAKDTQDLTRKTQELAKAQKDVGKGVGDLANLVDRIVRQPGAHRFGLSRDVLAKMPAEAIRDMASQLGLAGPSRSAPPPVSRSTPRPGDVFGLAPLDAQRVKPGFPGYLETYGVRGVEGGRPSLGLPPPRPKQARVVHTPQEVTGFGERFASGAADFGNAMTVMGSRAMPFAAAAYGALRVSGSVGQGIGGAKEAELLSDGLIGEDASVELQRLAYLREAMPGFDQIWRLRQNIRGIPAILAGQEREGQVLRETRVGVAERDHALRMEKLRQRGAEYAAAPLGGSLSTHSGADLLTAAGEKQFRRESDLIPIQNQRLNRERELNKARREAVGLEDELTKLTERREKLLREQGKYDEADIEIKKGELPDPVAMNARANQRIAIREELGVVNQQAVDVGQKLEAKRREEAELKAATAEDRLRERETRLGHLRQDFDITKGAATQFGIMRPFERQRNVQALEMVMEMGIDNAPPEMIAQAQSVAPRKINELALAAGQQDPAFARLRELSREDAPLDDLGKAAAQIGQESNEVIKERQKIADDKLKDMAEAVKEIGRIHGEGVNMIVLLKEQMESNLMKIRLDMNDMQLKMLAAMLGGTGPR